MLSDQATLIYLQGTVTDKTGTVRKTYFAVNAVKVIRHSIMTNRSRSLQLFLQTLTAAKKKKGSALLL